MYKKTVRRKEKITKCFKQLSQIDKALKQVFNSHSIHRQIQFCRKHLIQYTNQVDNVIGNYSYGSQLILYSACTTANSNRAITEFEHTRDARVCAVRRGSIAEVKSLAPYNATKQHPVRLVPTCTQPFDRGQC